MKEKITTITTTVFLTLFVFSCAGNKPHKPEHLYAGYEFVPWLEEGDKIRVKMNNQQWIAVDDNHPLRDDEEIIVFDHENQMFGLGFQGKDDGVGKETETFCFKGTMSLVWTRKRRGYVACTSSLVEADGAQTAKQHAKTLGIVGVLAATVGLGSFIYAIKYDKKEISKVLHDIDFKSMVDNFRKSEKLKAKEDSLIPPKIDEVEQQQTEVGTFGIKNYTEIKNDSTEDNKVELEFEGFRGIKWGTEITSLTNMKFLRTGPSYGGINYYTRVGDERIVGGASLDVIEYGFWDDRLSFVRIVVSGYQNCKLFKAVVFEKYGKEYRQPFKSTWFSWDGTNTKVIYRIIQNSTRNELHLSSVFMDQEISKNEPIRKQYELDKAREKAREGAITGF